MKIKKLALLSILSALAVVLSVMEGALMPDIAFLPPGAKPGLANIVIMFTASFAGAVPALCVVLIKSFFVFLTRGASAFAMSICGSLLSAVLLCVLLKIKKLPFSFTGIGVLCAVAHNMGQLACACILTGTSSLISYFPILILFGVLTGAVTGTVIKLTIPVLQKSLKISVNKGKERKENKQ